MSAACAAPAAVSTSAGVVEVSISLAVRMFVPVSGGISVWLGAWCYLLSLLEQKEINNYRVYKILRYNLKWRQE